MADPTPDEAAALALYDAAAWVKTYRDSMRIGSARAAAAGRIYLELLEWARRRQLGELYDPAIQADGEGLRRTVAARAVGAELAERLQRAATTGVSHEFDTSLAGLGLEDRPWLAVGRSAADAVLGELIGALNGIRAQLAKEDDQ